MATMGPGGMDTGQDRWKCIGGVAECLGAMAWCEVGHRKKKGFGNFGRCVFLDILKGFVGEIRHIFISRGLRQNQDDQFYIIFGMCLEVCFFWMMLMEISDGV